MSDLFELSMPWWHFVLRASLVYFGVMVLVRVSGKRAVGQFTPFDLVLLILIGNAVQNGLNGGDNSLTGALVLAVCLIALNYLMAWLTARFPRARSVVEGNPVELARDGRIYHEVLRRELVSKVDFREAMRNAGCDDVGKVGLAMLETNGHISIIVRGGDGGSN
ncbi:MAG TPA: YetF domain-containing protein [Luteimonas sp.]|nr:YetF domain-containing protein [Luteimonas sp.]